MHRFLASPSPLVLAAAAFAQVPVVTWTTGAHDLNFPANNVYLSGPAGIGATFVSATVQNPPLPTPWGPLWIGAPLLQLAVGPVSPNVPLAFFYSLPNDPAFLGARLAFTGAEVPTGANAAVISNAFTTRVGPLPGIGPRHNIPFELYGRAVGLGDRNLDQKDEVMVGVPGSNASGASQSGAVAIYSGGSSPPALVQTLVGPANPPQGGAAFGYALACAQIDGTGGIDVVVGEPLWDATPQITNVGRVHVYYAPSYSPVGVTLAPPAATAVFGLGFGTAVHVDNLDLAGQPEIVVGAPQEIGTGNGRVFVYDLGVATTPAYTLTDPAAYQGAFGRELASGNLFGSNQKELVVGDREWSTMGGFDRGRVYVFSGSSLVTSRESPSPIDNGKFGDALAVGNLVGDAYADLAVGAPGEGKVYIYAGGASGLATSPTVTLGQPGGGTSFGSEMLIADVNGDASLDLAVGNPIAGNVYVFLGTPGQANTFQLWSLLGRRDTLLTLFGFAIATGDQDGDGQRELWVGAPAQTTGLIDSGKVFWGRW
jgi:hypothetical protein